MCLRDKHKYIVLMSWVLSNCYVWFFNETLTCGVFAEDVRRGIARLAVSSVVVSRHSELVLASLQQACDFQTGVVDGVSLIHASPPVSAKESPEKMHHLRK